MKNLSESSTRKAYLYIIKLLSKRDYSTYKVKVKLQSKGYEEEHINEAIDEVVEKGYLNDEEYATARAKSFMIKGLHPQLIQTKLQEEHLSISSDSIQQLFEEYGISTSSQLTELLVKKIRTIGQSQLQNKQEATRQKLTRYCLSKGHEIEDITSTLDNLISDVN